MISQQIEDCVENILLNYLTFKTFWSPNYTQQNFKNAFVLSGTRSSPGITNATKLDDLWFDKTLGLRTPQGLRYWVKVIHLYKTTNSRMAEVIMKHFDLGLSVFTDITVSPASWLSRTIDQTLSSPC